MSAFIDGIDMKFKPRVVFVNRLRLRFKGTFGEPARAHRLKCAKRSVAQAPSLERYSRIAAETAQREREEAHQAYLREQERLRYQAQADALH
jgi:ribosomal protein L29